MYKYVNVHVKQGRAQELAEGGLRQISNVHVPTRKVHVPTRVVIESTCKQCVDTHTYICTYVPRIRLGPGHTVLRQILEFPQKRNLRFGGNLDFRVADFLRAEPSLWRFRFCGNANF